MNVPILIMTVCMIWKCLAATEVTAIPAAESQIMRFTQIVTSAQQEAKCYAAFGSKQNRTRSSGATSWVPSDKMAQPFGCFKLETSVQCEKCKVIADLHVSTLGQCAASCNASDDLCYEACFTLYNSSLITSTPTILEGVDIDANIPTESSTTSTEYVPYFLRPTEPIHKENDDRILYDLDVSCEGVYPEGSSQPQDHYAVLSWNTGSARNKSRAGSPLVFVVEQTEGNNMSEWKTIGKTTSGLYTANVSYYSSTYRWRITAVSPHGIEDIAETQDYTTLNGYQKPSPAKRIYIVETKVQQSILNILVGWDPPPERTCYYKIVIDGTNGMRSKTVRIQEPIGIHMMWFANLSFGKSYHALITSRDRAWQYESIPTVTEFKTPSCLESFGYRFDKCAPPPVNHYDIKQTILKTGESHLDVELRWKPPPHTSKTNTIEKYEVEVTPFILSLSGSHPYMNYSANELKSTNYTVDGNVTKLLLNLDKDMDYVVLITAYSIRGPSPQTQYRLSTKLTFTRHQKSKVSDEYYRTTSYYVITALAISLVVVILVVCFIIIRQRRKKTKRIDEHTDWPTPQWDLFDEEFPKEQWEISLDDLSMGEVIGQGAFGVVRKAKVKREKLKQKLRMRGEYGKCPITAADENDPELETVAVKMVTVSSTRDDREQLMKEVTMMQNLGFHPQIVGLWGACSRGETLCLVLEYCPGGDLLSFIRRVRHKYWPTMTMSFFHSQVSSTSNPNRRHNLIKASETGGNSRGDGGSGGCKKSKSHSHSSSSTGNQKRSNGTQSSIKYMDARGLSSESDRTGDIYGPPVLGEMIPFSGQCKTNTKNLERRANVNSDGRSHSSKKASSSRQNTKDEDFHPINEGDVLSYMKQIAQAMEYLEKNRIVHRDLACRNVLLMGDFKNVKISDFGLSRDVYSWNVYEQKSNGRVPIKWMAVESIFTNMFTIKSDVWSYGILLWELLTLGGAPYPGLGHNELFDLLKKGHRMGRPDNCSHELYALMKKCWRSSPSNRPSFAELRHYIETMMESTEPKRYLSLDADIPKDFYDVNFMDDLNLINELEIPPRSPSIQAGPSFSYPTSASACHYENTVANPVSNDNDGDDDEEEECSRALLQPPPPPMENLEESMTAINPSYTKCTFSKYSPVNKTAPEQIQLSQELSTAPPINLHQERKQSRLTCIPFIHVNDMTMAENRAYDLLDP